MSYTSSEKGHIKNVHKTIMENKETLYKSEYQKTLMQNSDYYKYIFKKTEKIACAVLYIMRSNRLVGQTDPLVKDMEDAVRQLMDISYGTLRTKLGMGNKILEDLQFALVVLQSRLNIAHATFLLEREFLDVFAHELDSVQRSLKAYSIENNGHSVFDFLNPHDTPEKKPLVKSITSTAIRRMESTQGISEKVEKQAVSGMSRRDRILAVLENKGQATIKDISESVTECSEKTIQRELILLIKDNRIVREGERRWSKYSIV